MMEQGVHEGVSLITRSRDERRRPAGGLVEDEQIVVLVKEVRAEFILPALPIASTCGTQLA